MPLIPWVRDLISNMTVENLVESNGIFQYGNRSYDSLVASGATSVLRQKLGGYTVRKNVGEAPDALTRAKAKGGSSMVKTVLDTYGVGLQNEIAAQFESNDALRKEHSIRMADALREQFDADFIAAGMQTPFVYDTLASGKLDWKDLIKVQKHFRNKKVKAGRRVTIIDTDLEDEFLSIDVIKSATAYSVMKLANGDSKYEFNGQTYFISSLMPKLEGQPCILGVHGPGLASIVSHFGVIKETWDSTLMADIIDMIAQAAFELDGNEFACIVKLKA